MSRMNLLSSIRCAQSTLSPRRLAWLAIPLILFLAACGTASGGQPTPTPVPPVVSVEKAVFPVERGSIIMKKDLAGEVIPSKQDDLFFRASGFVNRIVVKQGDLVKKDDILAEIQVDDLMNQLQQANIDLEVARSNLSKAKGQRQLDLDRAKAEVVIKQKYVDMGAIDVQQAYGVTREKAQLNLDIANQNLTLAQQALEMMKADSNPYEEQAVQRSQLAVDRLQKLVSERQIVAPYDGQILRSLARPGTQVDAFSTMFVIGDPSELVVRAAMDYDLQDKLSADSAVTLRVISDAKDPKDMYAAKFLPNFLPISTVKKNEDTTTALTGLTTDYLYFSLPKDVPADKAPVGRSVFLSVILGKKDNVLLLPPAAIREYKGLNFVIVQEGTRRRRVEITEIGLKGTDRWEITADLKPGDQVLGP